MFQRFTDRASKALALANQEAQRFGHEYIGTEHILLGLIGEGSGVGAAVLKNLDVDLRTARREVEKLVKSGPDMVTEGRLPPTPGAKKVIHYAIEEARNFNHNYVGTEHLMLGLLREKDGIAAQVLRNLSLHLEQAREEVLNLLGCERASEDIAATPSDADRIVQDRTEPARESTRGSNLRRLEKVIERLNVERDEAVRTADHDRAVRLRHRLELLGIQKEIEHLTIEKDQAVHTGDYERAAELRDQTEALKIQQQATIREWRKWSGETVRPAADPDTTNATARDRGRTSEMSERFTDRARKAMALANQEAQRFGHEYIGTEHILLGLVREGSGVGANVLKYLDVDLPTVRVEVEKLVERGADMTTVGRLPQTPQAKKVIENAIEEARRLIHNYVGTEHLLLGLLREPDSVAAQVLMNLGLELDGVREEVLNVLGRD